MSLVCDCFERGPGSLLQKREIQLLVRAEIQFLDRETRHAAVHGVAKSRTRLSD